MSLPEKKGRERSLEGHYNYYGTPAYILKQRNGAYASGFYDPFDGIFKAGGCAKKILWDGVKLSDKEAKKLIREYTRTAPLFEDEEGLTPEWILLPEEATHFMKQADEIRATDTAEVQNTPDEPKGNKIDDKEMPGNTGELV